MNDFFQDIRLRRVLLEERKTEVISLLPNDFLSGQGFRVVTGNYGYVCINPAYQWVYKFYVSSHERDKEYYFYQLLADSSIRIPRIIDSGELWPYSFLKIENVRKWATRPTYSVQTGGKLGATLSSLHAIQNDSGKVLIHGSLDNSNFFEMETWDIGILDFMSLRYSFREEDFAILFINSSCDIHFLKSCLRDYLWRDKFSESRFWRIFFSRIQLDLRNAFDADMKTLYLGYLHIWKKYKDQSLTH